VGRFGVAGWLASYPTLFRKRSYSFSQSFFYCHSFLSAVCACMCVYVCLHEGGLIWRLLRAKGEGEAVSQSHGFGKAVKEGRRSYNVSSTGLQWRVGSGNLYTLQSTRLLIKFAFAVHLQIMELHWRS